MLEKLKAKFTSLYSMTFDKRLCSKGDAICMIITYALWCQNDLDHVSRSLLTSNASQYSLMYALGITPEQLNCNRTLH